MIWPSAAVGGVLASEIFFFCTFSQLAVLQSILHYSSFFPCPKRFIFCSYPKHSHIFFMSIGCSYWTELNCYILKIDDRHAIPRLHILLYPVVETKLVLWLWGEITFSELLNLTVHLIELVSLVSTTSYFANICILNAFLIICEILYGGLLCLLLFFFTEMLRHISCIRFRYTNVSI